MHKAKTLGIEHVNGGKFTEKNRRKRRIATKACSNRGSDEQ